MKTTLSPNPGYEFYFPERDTLLRVEEADGSVVIRATRDSFSATRKTSLIRELAAEGFIPDSYRWFASADRDSLMGVKWLVDISWLTLPETALTRARCFMQSMLFGSCLVWLGLMASLLAGWLGDGASSTISKAPLAVKPSADANPIGPQPASHLRGLRSAR